MTHDRHLEEPPEHPDDCDCRECTHPQRDVEAVEIMRSEISAHPSDCTCSECTTLTDGHGPECGCDECLPLSRAHDPFHRSPLNDTHRCSGGPEEITDEEWERARFRR